MRWLAVTPSPAHSLHVALEACRQPQVQHGPHIWPVQAHSEGHCGHHHPQPAVHEGLLHPPPLPATHAGVVGFGYSLGGLSCKEDMDSWVDCVPWAGLWSTTLLTSPLRPRSRASRRQVRSRAATRSVSSRLLQ